METPTIQTRFYLRSAVTAVAERAEILQVSHESRASEGFAIHDDLAPTKVFLLCGKACRTLPQTMARVQALKMDRGEFTETRPGRHSYDEYGNNEYELLYCCCTYATLPLCRHSVLG